MKASETRFQQIIEGTKQYIVPLFQRPYSWEKKEWDTLWDDLVDLYENDKPKYHFIGSLVTIPTDFAPEGVSKYLLIDGQQRLTTIFILFTVLRDLAKKNDFQDLADEITQTLLVNKFKKESDYFKLLTTQLDRDSFQTLITNGAEKVSPSKIKDCYLFFERRIRNNRIDIAKFKEVITNRLSAVSIVLDHDDNPHVVFESLNAKGYPLTQADLIRNYFFMRISADLHDKIHKDYWEPMQRDLGENLTEFIRHYLMREGAKIKQSDVYFTLREHYNNRDALEALREIAHFSKYYQKLLQPTNEASSKIQEALIRLNRLEIATSYPFLLNCYHDYDRGDLSHDNFVEILHIIENYIIRRSVCGVPTNDLNKIFPGLYSQVKVYEDFVKGVREELQKRKYPKDAEFHESLRQSDLYRDRSKIRFILENLERALSNKETVNLTNEISIEHVLPQSLTPWWRKHLGPSAEEDHDLVKNTLGNLTLTGYNSELSTKPYDEKRKILSNSPFALNRYFRDVERWTRKEIEDRSSFLADQALKVWSYFGYSRTSMVVSTDLDITGKKPVRMIISGQEYKVNTWRDVLESLLNMIIEREPEDFEQIASERPRIVGLDSKRFRAYRQLKNGYYVEVNLSAKEINQICRQIISSLDWLDGSEFRIDVQ